MSNRQTGTMTGFEPVFSDCSEFIPVNEVTLLYGIIQKHERMIRQTVPVVLNHFIITNESRI
jgi:hypothetical protein